jgi:hypothetical protein
MVKTNEIMAWFGMIIGFAMVFIIVAANFNATITVLMGGVVCWYSWRLWGEKPKRKKKG